MDIHRHFPWSKIRSPLDNERFFLRFKLPIKKTKSTENTCKAKQIPLKDLLDREQDNLFVDRIDRVERMKNTS